MLLMFLFLLLLLANQYKRIKRALLNSSLLRVLLLNVLNLYEQRPRMRM